MSTKALIFSAPSGSGKTTIVRHLLSTVPSLQFSISATTRSPRGKEIHGHDYYFFSREEFVQKIKNNEFIEWEEVYSGTKYGTLKSEIERIWSEGKTVVFDVDVIGGLNLKKQLGEIALAVFIKVPNLSELEKRLIKRKTEEEDAIQNRMAKALKEMSFEKRFDITIVNEDLSKAQVDVQELVQKFIQS